MLGKPSPSPYLHTVQHNTARNEGLAHSCGQSDETVLEKAVFDDVELVVALGIIEREYPFFDRDMIGLEQHGPGLSNGYASKSLESTVITVLGEEYQSRDVYVQGKARVLNCKDDIWTAVRDIR